MLREKFVKFKHVGVNNYYHFDLVSTVVEIPVVIEKITFTIIGLGIQLFNILRRIN